MPKYWGKQIFTHGRFPEVGLKVEGGEKEKRRKKKKKKVGENNGQLRFVRHHAWRSQARLDQFSNSKSKINPCDLFHCLKCTLGLYLPSSGLDYGH